MSVSQKNAGVSLVEVMVTIVILMFGLLGLAGLQGRAVIAQMESYQRSQALVLVKDMVDRINANRKNALAYTGNNPLGVGSACPAAGATVASKDLSEWCSALQGAAEVQGSTNVGAMIGARGCVTQEVAPASGVPSQHLVVVAWQGLSSTAAPPIDIDCGKDEYGNDALRRVVAIPVNIANLN